MNLSQSSEGWPLCGANQSWLKVIVAEKKAAKAAWAKENPNCQDGDTFFRKVLLSTGVQNKANQATRTASQR